MSVNVSICTASENCLEGTDIEKKLLRELSEEKIQASIPVLCFITVIILLGTLGNLLVFATYFKQLHKSSTNFFIFCLASFDLICCLVSLPVELFFLLRPLTNDYPWVCKMYRWLSFSADIASGYTIVCISFDRYLRIAHPHSGFSRRTSRRAVLAVVCTSLLVCSMSLFVYGTESVRVAEHPQVTGYRCGTDAYVKETFVPLLFSTIVLVAFVVGVFIMLVVYVRLGIVVRRWNKGRAGHTRYRKTGSEDSSSKSDKTVSKSHSETPKCQVPLLIKDIARVKDEFATREPKLISAGDDFRTKEPKDKHFEQNNKRSLKEAHLTDTEISEADNKSVESLPVVRTGIVKEMTRSLERNGFSIPNPSVHFDGTATLPLRKLSSRQCSKRKPARAKSFIISDLKKRMSLSKTTTMFIVATAAFVACHVPYICVKIVFLAKPDLEETLSQTEMVFYSLAQYSYAVSYAVNPIIYSFLNSRFRMECRKILTKLLKRLTCTKAFK